MEYKEHRVIWTNEKVSRFWNYISKNERLRYFAQDVGEEILDIVEKTVGISGNVLDYACGNGFLINYLFKRNIKNVSGCDFSNNSVEFVNNKFKEEPKYGRVFLLNQLPSEMPNNFYDYVFFLETIEHLLDEYFDSTLKELNRVTKKGGYLILTTRNNENLKDLEVNCPDCGCIFHRVQHVKSFTTEEVVKIMNSFGYRMVLCSTVNLGQRRGDIFAFLLKVYHFFKPRINETRVNLIYIGQKI